MADMTGFRRPVFLLIALLLAAISIILIAGVSVTQATTELVQTKTEQALSITMENLAPQWPRIETHSDLATKAYYAPIINPVQTFELDRHVLEYLNQDTRVPPVKITQVSVTYEDGPTEDTLISQARVDFPLILGIEKEIVVHSAVKIPHYPTLK
jgi:hypothetical protein